MKTFYRYIFALFFGFLFVVSGCKEINISTKINSNGTLERLISIRGDSSGVGTLGYPIPNDSTWTIECQKDPQNDPKKVLWNFSKSYEIPEMVNADFYQNDSTLQINPLVNFSKKFQWIYSYYSYSETFMELGPLFLFPDSVARNQYLAKRDSASDIDKWNDELLFESFFQTLIKELQEDPIEGLSIDFVKSKREELLQATDDIDGDVDKLYENLLTICKKVLLLESVEPLKHILNAFWLKLEKYLVYLGSVAGESYQNHVNMPGQIIDTNADKIEGNDAIWEFSGEDFETDDYVMWVESRKMNLLPTILTAIVLLGIIAVLFYLTLWGKTQNHRDSNPSQYILNKWISIILLVGGILVLTIGFLLTISMWNWTILFFQVHSVRDRILFILIDAVGFFMMLIGGIHLFRLKAHRKRKSGN